MPASCAAAVELPASADVAVVFLGLPAAAESEGYDREHIDLPAAQLELLEDVLEVNSNTVVVLSNGSVVALPFADRVPAILCSGRPAGERPPTCSTARSTRRAS
jgi:beta-glucosidase